MKRTLFSLIASTIFAFCVTTATAQTMNIDCVFTDAKPGGVTDMSGRFAAIRSEGGKTFRIVSVGPNCQAEAAYEGVVDDFITDFRINSQADKISAIIKTSASTYLKTFVKTGSVITETFSTQRPHGGSASGTLEVDKTPYGLSGMDSYSQ